MILIEWLAANIEATYPLLWTAAGIAVVGIADYAIGEHVARRNARHRDS